MTRQRQETAIHRVDGRQGLPMSAVSAAADIVEALVEGSQHSPFGMVRFPELSTSVRVVELESESARRAGFLLSNGIPSGEPVGVLAAHRPEFLVDLFGVLRAGATAVVLPFQPGAQHYRAGLESIVEVMAAAGLRHVVAGGALRTVGERLAELRPGVTYCGEGLADTLTPLPFVQQGQSALVSFSVDADGDLVGNSFTHGQLVAGIKAVRWSAGLGVEDVLVQWLPMYDPLGLFALLSQLFVGGRVHAFTPQRMKVDPAEVLAELGRLRATVTLGRARSYARLGAAAATAAPSNGGLARWRAALVGGALEPEDVERFDTALAPAGAREVTLTPMYHVPGAAFAVTCKQPDTAPTVLRVDRELLRERGTVAAPTSGDRELRLVSRGHPVVGMRLRIVDGDGTPVAADVVGYIEISGKAVLSGYHRDLRRTLRAMRNGWLRTGDRGFLAYGELFVLPGSER